MVLYDAAKAALAECERVDVAKDWADKGEALALYAKRANDPELEYRARRIRARAAIRLGELSAALPKAPGGRPAESETTHSAVDSFRPKKEVLADAGVNAETARRAEMLSALPVEEREEAIERDVPATLTELLGRASRHANRKASAETRRPADAAPGRYAVVLADPPWRYEHPPMSGSRAVETHYPTMDLAAIKALPVGELLADDAVLFLWTTSPKLAESIEVLPAWGFGYRTCAVWVKASVGMGYYFRQRHELLLVGARGKMAPPAPADRRDSVFEAPRTKHSEKPAAVHEWIEQAYADEPKVELFARKPRAGWAVWGNEVGE